ncbi:MAG: sugar phosphate isomerase/epimerase family protein [Armatimonadota bacterium]
MLDVKYSINAGFLGKCTDRFFTYGEDRALEQKLELVTQIEGADGVELKLPRDLEDPAPAKELLAKYNLPLAAVNVDLKGLPKWLHGSLTSPRPERRAEAVALLKCGMDIAADLGAGLVTCCPVADGYDYPFQVEYPAAWDNFIDGIREAAQHRDDVRLSLEYQPTDPHPHILLRNAGTAAYVCEQAGLPNVGVTLDIGHSFMAGENPAEAACLLARTDRLFYIHTDDSTGGGDWDLLSGTMHFWHFLELLHYLDTIGYDGWLGADIFPRQFDAADGFAANIRLLNKMADIVDRLDTEKLASMMQSGGQSARMFEYLSSVL